MRQSQRLAKKLDKNRRCEGNSNKETLQKEVLKKEGQVVSRESKKEERKAKRSEGLKRKTLLLVASCS